MLWKYRLWDFQTTEGSLDMSWNEMVANRQKLGLLLIYKLLKKWTTVAVHLKPRLLAKLRAFSKKVLLNKLKFSCNKKASSVALNPSAALKVRGYVLSV